MKFVHCTGACLVQVLEGRGLLFLPNYLYLRNPLARGAAIESPRALLRQLKSLCENADELQAFWMSEKAHMEEELEEELDDGESV